MKPTLRCPKCNKLAKETSRLSLGKSILLRLECGHTVAEDKLTTHNDFQDTSFDGKLKLYPYQAEDIQRAQTANFRCLVEYECGLGKTIFSTFSVMNYIDDLKPILVIGKQAVIVQWWREFERTMNFNPIILLNGKSKPIKGCPIHLVSFDMARRMRDKLEDFKFKTVIIDECQHIKDPNSQRTQAINGICESAKHVLGLSATPIKNNAGEFYSILHILQPSRFYSEAAFKRQHVETLGFGKYQKLGGLRDPKYFKTLTDDFIFYRKRSDVLPDLPPKRRNFQYLDIEDPELQKAYDKQVDELTEFMNEAELSGKKDLSYYNNILEFLGKMRHITGLAKVDECVERIIEFLESTERKLVVYHHHIDVGDMIEAKLQMYCREKNITLPLRLLGGKGAQYVDEIKTKILDFSDEAPRVLIASTLAAGEGINLQPISDAIQVERQWNSVNEEQAEDRFSRPGATADKVNIDYLIAISTVDDYLTEMVERKRAYVQEQHMETKVDLKENDALTQLAQTLVSKGKPRWRLS